MLWCLDPGFLDLWSEQPVMHVLTSLDGGYCHEQPVDNVIIIVVVIVFC